MPLVKRWAALYKSVMMPAFDVTTPMRTNIGTTT
jgi:hypothetical protein